MVNKSIILNGMVIQQGDYQEALTVFYEVIRVNNGALMFLEDHIRRLNHSLQLANIEKEILVEEVYADLNQLFKVDGIRNQNVKYAIHVEDGLLTCALYYNESFYLGTDTYKKGVSVKLERFEREHPEIKQLTLGMATIRNRLKLDDVYEYLLVDHSDEILEGTKTNVFFVKGNRVITASTAKVLGGITRHHVAALASEYFEFDETELLVDNLDSVDALFLTGTSIGILPVYKVGDYLFDSSANPVVQSLMEQYKIFEQNYIQTHQLTYN
jgi:branched-chain amino acid aminotransferase